MRIWSLVYLLWVCGSLSIPALGNSQGTGDSPPGQPSPETWSGDRPDRLRLPATTPMSQRFRDVLSIMAMVDTQKDKYEQEARAVSVETAIDRGLEKWSSAGFDALPWIPLYAFMDPPGMWDYSLVNGGGNWFRPPWAVGPLILWNDPLEPVIGSLDHEFAVIAFIADEEGAWQGEARVTTLSEWPECSTQRNQVWKIGSHRKRELPAWSKVEHFPGGFEFDAYVATDSSIQSTGRIFEEQTRLLLESAPNFRREVVGGAERMMQQLDRLKGLDILGHTGLCIGDANGDGLEDLYVPQMGGVPNALLIQREDGTIVDKAKEAGVDLLDMTRACLFADLDNDGDQDLALSVRNATVIYENDGKGKFGGADARPVLSARTGTPSEFYSIAAADYDDNKRLDLYSVRYVKATYGVSIPIPYYDANNGPPNHLLANLGGWRFEDQTEKAGLNQNNARFSLAAGWEDCDDDGDQDLFVANDFGKANLYVNQNGEFSDEAEQRGALNQAAGMGVTWGDYDGDGLMDLYVSNMFSAPGMRIMKMAEFRPTDSADDRRQFLGHSMGNSLFRNLGDGKFREVAGAMGVARAGWSWGAMFADINNDGWEDLLVPNGNLTGTRPDDIDSLFWRRVASESPLTVTAAPKYEDGWAATTLLMGEGYSWAGHQRNATFLNLGGKEFVDVSMLSGFGFKDDSRAIALCDWDQDGDVDVWVKNRTAPMIRYLRNMTRERSKEGTSHFVQFELEGRTSNRDAVGARITIEADGRRYVKTVRAGEGYLAQSSHRVHFGLGEVSKFDSMWVRWPGGKVESFDLREVDRCYRVIEGSGPGLEAMNSREPLRFSPDSGEIQAEKYSVDDRRRIVLVDRLPLPGMEFNSTGGQKVNTEQKLGSPCIWFLWSARSPRSIEALRTLSSQINKLRQTSIEVIPICVDEGAVLEQAVVVAKEIDPNIPIITAPKSFADFLDAVQQEILGNPQDLFLPTTFIVDRLGLLAAVHRWGIDIDEVIADANRKPGEQFPFTGRVLFPASRNYGFLTQLFRQRGLTEWADYYQNLARHKQEGR